MNWLLYDCRLHQFPPSIARVYISELPSHTKVIKLGLPALHPPRLYISICVDSSVFPLTCFYRPPSPIQSLHWPQSKEWCNPSNKLFFPFHFFHLRPVVRCYPGSVNPISSGSPSINRAKVLSGFSFQEVADLSIVVWPQKKPHTRTHTRE